MKAIISTLAVLILMIGAQSAFADASNYQWGFENGESDAHKDVSQMYILEPGHGFQYQFNDTIKGMDFAVYQAEEWIQIMQVLTVQIVRFSKLGGAGNHLYVRI